MKGSEALGLLLTCENVEKIMLPSSAMNRKIVIIKKDMDYIGIHLSGVSFNSDAWVVCVTLEGEKGAEYLWKKVI